MLLVWLKRSAIGQSLNFFSNLIVFLLGLFHVLSLQAAKDSLMLHLERFFFSSFLLHFVHEDFVGVDLIVELGGIATLILVDSTQVFLQLIPVSLVSSRFLSCLLLNISKLLCPLQLSLILSTSTSRLEFIFEFRILLGKVLRQLLLDFFLGVLVVLQDSLEILVSSCILQLLFELGQFVALLHLEVLLEFLFL